MYDIVAAIRGRNLCCHTLEIYAFAVPFPADWAVRVQKCMSFSRAPCFAERECHQWMDVCWRWKAERAVIGVFCLRLRCLLRFRTEGKGGADCYMVLTRGRWVVLMDEGGRQEACRLCTRLFWKFPSLRRAHMSDGRGYFKRVPRIVKIGIKINAFQWRRCASNRLFLPFVSRDVRALPLKRRDRLACLLCIPRRHVKTSFHSVSLHSFALSLYPSYPQPPPQPHPLSSPWTLNLRPEA